MSEANKVEKLRGRENYDTWSLTAKSYLVVKDLWKYVIIKPTFRNESEESDIEQTPRTSDQKGINRTIAEIIFLIDTSIFSFVYGFRSAYEVWEGLKNAFADSGTARKVTILHELVSITLEKTGTMENYVNTLLLYWNKVKEAGFTIQEDVIASLMLGDFLKNIEQ